MPNEMLSQELVSIPEDTALAVFSAPDTSKLDPILQKVRAHVDAFLPLRDLTTVAGRKEIASVAYSVARAKTAIEDAGKKVAAEAKEIPKRIDANRKYVKDTLDTWRDEVRKPLDDWEAAEDARIKRHTDAIELMSEAARLPHDATRQQIANILASVEAVSVGPECEEFVENYARAKESALAILQPALEAARRREAEQAELERLRAEAAEREARERDERIAREAAEAARLESERKAREEIEARERAARAEVEAAEARARADAEASERREREAREAAEAAERRALQAEQEAREKLAREQAAQKAEDDRRAADREHKAAIHREALSAIAALGMSEALAIKVITAIVKGEIPHVSIRY